MTLSHKCICFGSNSARFFRTNEHAGRHLYFESSRTRADDGRTDIQSYLLLCSTKLTIRQHKPKRRLIINTNKLSFN
eukprot:scaffold23831_cov127-Cylindrotheca_fusiformis.AAC.2